MYQVVIDKQLEKQLEKIPHHDYFRVKKAILDLAIDPRPKFCIKLKSRSAYRIRQGDYRIIYEIHDRILTVVIIEAGHRKDIYN